MTPRSVSPSFSLHHVSNNISSSGTKVTTEAVPGTILNLNIADECHQYSVVIARVVVVELLAILLDISKVSEVAEYVVAATIITAVLRWSVVTEI